MTDFVEIFEVGPRNGLQNEPGDIAVADKITFVDMLSDAGFRRIECASFVSPKWVPQMAGSGAVLGGIKRAEGVRYADEFVRHKVVDICTDEKFENNIF